MFSHTIIFSPLEKMRCVPGFGSSVRAICASVMWSGLMKIASRTLGYPLTYLCSLISDIIESLLTYRLCFSKHHHDTNGEGYEGCCSDKLDDMHAMQARL